MADRRTDEASGRTKPRQISDRRLGNRCRARPDEEEEGLASPPLGRFRPKEPAAFSRGQVGLSRPESKGVGLGANLTGRYGLLIAASTGHERRPGLPPGFDEKLHGIEELLAGFRQPDQGRKRSP